MFPLTPLHRNGLLTSCTERLGESITQQDIAYAREILEAVGYSVDKPDEVTHDEHQTRVLAGYKSALSSEYL